MPLDLSFRHEQTYYSRVSGTLLLQGDIDLTIFEKFIQLGEVVLDAGANIGITAAEMAHCGASEVHAFEAHPNSIRRLKSIQSDKSNVHPFGLSDRCDFINLYESTIHSQGSTTDVRIIDLFAAVFSGLASTRVPVKSLDNVFSHFIASFFCAKCFDFMKVNIEGTEGPFLRSANKTISRACPKPISMELYDQFFDEAYTQDGRWFSHCYRAILCINNYNLDLKVRSRFR